MYQVRTGGLMRCCLKTLEDLNNSGDLQAREKVGVKCPYCVDGWMRFRDGSWEWDRDGGKKEDEK